jgi:hypothetical protein
MWWLLSISIAFWKGRVVGISELELVLLVECASATNNLASNFGDSWLLFCRHQAESFLILGIFDMCWKDLGEAVIFNNAFLGVGRWF